jgi:hypothetical protein
MPDLHILRTNANYTQLTHPWCAWRAGSSSALQVSPIQGGVLKLSLMHEYSERGDLSISGFVYNNENNLLYDIFQLQARSGRSELIIFDAKDIRFVPYCG